MAARKRKVDPKHIMSRTYEDTMAMPAYSFNIGENQGSIAAVSLAECTLRHQDRRERQLPEISDFWDRYLDSR